MFCNQCGAANVDGSRFCSDCGGPITLSTPGKKPAAVAAETEIGLPIGTILANRYRILGILGMGGMGRVYVAEDQKLETRVAIKVLREVLSRDPGPRSRECRGEGRAGAMRWLRPRSADSAPRAKKQPLPW